MFKRDGDWWLYLAGGVAGVFGLRWLYQQTTGDDPLDILGDDLVALTSTDDQRIQQMQPDAAAAVYALVQNLSDQGISVHVGQTLRTAAAEKKAIADGKSAETTYSWHEIGRAVDMYPIDPNTGKPDMDGVRDDLFQKMVAAALPLGFRSLAYEADGVTRHYIQTSKGPVWDGGHLEYRSPYSSLAQAIAAEGAAYGIA